MAESNSKSYVEVELKEEKLKISLPKGYLNQDDKSITHIKKKEDDDENKKEVEELFSPILVVPIEVVNNIDNYQEKINLAINKYGTWKIVPVPKKVISSKSDILQLADYGIPVNSINAKEWVKYFERFEQECFITGKIPIITAVTKLGWRENYTKFIPFCDEYLVDVDINLQRVLEAYHTKGTLEEWINSIKDLRTNILFRFILSTSFAGPLLSIIGHRNFGVYNYGASRAGKTAMLLTSLSIWGEAKQLCSTFNHTTVGVERMAELRNDLILGMDERQIQKSQTELEKLVFVLCSGKGKVRGNKTGGVQLTSTFNIIMLMTGESTLAITNSTSGIGTRILELEGSPFNYDEELSSKMYEITSKYYGTAGREFIRILIEKYSKNNYQELKNKYEEIKETIKAETENDISSYISSVSLVVLADIIAGKELFGEDNEEKSISMGLEILKKLPTSQEIDIIEKSYKDVYSWILSNNSSFDIYKEPKSGDLTDDVVHQGFGKSFGLYDNDVYYVHTNILKDWFDKNNYSERKILSGWAEKGYILTNTNSKGKVENAIQKKFKGRNARMVAFPMKVAQATENQRKRVEEEIKKMKMVEL